ncbi:hypothetical protein SeSPB_A3718 [Salmonella enterica subsp. enterica serovar Saintpaul str. SARA29]|uniref:Uncharacterized protein n=1 Tax=Salmonella typhimurium (strain 14028s / SGSC 2262) TaxID=588858 RepID=A0A0F6B7Y5_SALT1|nr:hypothetical protein STM14_4243 [Salmonella enterica subsp. enterica serovar Typhimurium str. 14028S]AQU54222.1 hypothetical protein SEETMRM10607_18970 [Salmonella enterica subsp. enterica serovar Typhimurium]EDZ13718.1 hypothetical protein SeSPB_A3718 [Salmonella enterica subsp. enterica serovar Saintpaul str. SARA29]
MRENEREAYPACGRDIFPGRVGRMPLSGARLVTFRDYS